MPNGYTANGGKRPDNELSLDEIATLIQGFATLGTTKVRLTGGEPSIRHDLPQIIELAKQTQGIKTVAVSSSRLPACQTLDRPVRLDWINSISVLIALILLYLSKSPALISYRLC